MHSSAAPIQAVARDDGGHAVRHETRERFARRGSPAHLAGAHRGRLHLEELRALPIEAQTDCFIEWQRRLAGAIDDDKMFTRAGERR